jgi:hypothetical protein
MKALFGSKESAGGKDQEEADPEAIYRIGHQDVEGALKSTNASA